MQFDKESDFEEAVIQKLIEYGWEPNVLRHPTEEDLLKNWAEILFNNNRQRDRLNNCPLTDSEMQQIMEQIILLHSPLKLNDFINGRSVSIKRDNPDDQEHLGKEVSLKIYDRQEIALGESRYQIAQQPHFKTKSPILNSRRGDLMLLINGMPVIHIELKKSDTPVSEAFNQIEKYSHEGVFRGIFSLVQVFVAMEPKETVYFANPGEDGVFNKEFYFHWADFDNNQINDWDKVIANLLNIPMAHMLIGFYTIADTGDGILKVMRSYQYFAANGIADKVAKKKKNWDDGQQLGGHIWHTTGSGKTMTSFKSAQLVASSHDADKVVFLVDRKELGIQSLKEYRAFAGGSDTVEDTDNTDILISKLKEDTDECDLIVTSIQKMSNISEETDRLKEDDLKKIQSKRIVIIIDECHRSTFGEMLITIKNTFKRSLIFGFTGTPIHDVNTKNDNTTSDIFGSELHRYTLAHGIEDGNVLGFDTYKVTLHDDYDMRHEIALKKANAKTDAEVQADPKKQKVFYKYMDSTKVKMYGEQVGDRETGKWVPGIEDFISNEQYKEPEYRQGIIDDIKKKWTVYSRGRKFHAIFATSSIPEAVAYYRLMKDQMPDLNITALFDPTIDNEGGGTLDKEDGIVEMLEDYYAMFSQQFTIPTYDKFRKDVSLRMAHKKPYNTINQDQQIDILIVVNQMLTGFDSKWVNTLYLDKVMEYENLIQAMSRTNRLYNRAEKPFGIIKYYRRPHTMEKNIEAAVKEYSGDVPLGLFVDKLPQNIRQMNRLFDDIDTLFKNATYEGKPINNFDHLPDASADRAKFAKLFNQFNRHLEAALIQGFQWSIAEYEDENGAKLLPHLDEVTYHILISRYKEVAKGGGGGRGEGTALDIEIHITEYDTATIDANYMNEKFDIFVKLIQGEYDQATLDKILKELHKSFSMLSPEEQKYANIFIHDVQAGNIIPEDGKTFRDYISDMMKEAENDRIKRVVRRLGCYEKLLREMLSKRVTKENIEDQGKFDTLKGSVDKQKATNFFITVERDAFRQNRLAIYVDRYLRYFLLSGGDDPYPDVEQEEQPKVDSTTEVIEDTGVVLTDEELEGKTRVSNVQRNTVSEWYSESKALACLMDTGCFAYVDNRLCIYDEKYIERDSNGRLHFTQYALDHEEECFLQFVLDPDETLHYISLPESVANKSYHYADEISEEILRKHGLVGEISDEMLKAISGMDFGDALKKLMSKQICGYSVGLLKDTTGLDNRTVSNMRSGKNLNHVNVVSACLGIHIPFPVSNRMLELAGLSIRSDIPGKVGDNNRIYDGLLHINWACDYSETYDDLKADQHEDLIHEPPI